MTRYPKAEATNKNYNFEKHAVHGASGLIRDAQNIRRAMREMDISPRKIGVRRLGPKKRPYFTEPDNAYH